MSYVIRMTNPPGKSAMAHEATAVALTKAIVEGNVEIGPYLQWSNPDAFGGKGADGWTNDVAKAQRFKTFAEAAECWKAQSTVKPFRPDGKPNRPMTAYSVTIEDVP